MQKKDMIAIIASAITALTEVKNSLATIEVASTNSFVSEAVNLYNAHTGQKETYISLKRAIKEMWESVGYDEKKANSYVSSRIPWSAAFISYVVQKAGLEDFKYVYHSCYLTDARDGKLSHAKAYDAKKVKLAVGDIIVTTRKKSYASIKSVRCTDPMHGDIVIDIKDGKAITVGGNVANAISQSTFSLDANGHLSSSKAIGVVRFSFPTLNEE